MNHLLHAHLERLNSLSSNIGIEYHLYHREADEPFSVHLSFTDSFGVRRHSWGASFSKDEAFGKALMEMIERLYFNPVSPLWYRRLNFFSWKKTSLFELSKTFKIPIKNLHPSNTNGVAIHISKKKALESAIFELIERHSILSAILFDINPHFSFGEKSRAGKKIEFHGWRSPLNTYTVVGVVTDNQGCYFSSACASTKKNAQEKALLELSSFIHLPNENELNWQIQRDDIQSFNKYHKFSGDFSALKFLRGRSFRELPTIDKSEFYYCEIPQPLQLDGLPKLPCVRVINPGIQQLFFDNWSEDYINPRIFKDKMKLPSFPHIIA